MVVLGVPLTGVGFDDAIQEDAEEGRRLVHPREGIPGLHIWIRQQGADKGHEASEAHQHHAAYNRLNKSWYRGRTSHERHHVADVSRKAPDLHAVGKPCAENEGDRENQPPGAEVPDHLSIAPKLGLRLKTRKATMALGSNAMYCIQL